LKNNGEKLREDSDTAFRAISNLQKLVSDASLVITVGSRCFASLNFCYEMRPNLDVEVWEEFVNESLR